MYNATCAAHSGQGTSCLHSKSILKWSLICLRKPLLTHCPLQFSLILGMDGFSWGSRGDPKIFPYPLLKAFTPTRMSLQLPHPHLDMSCPLEALRTAHCTPLKILDSSTSPVKNENTPLVLNCE